uniref:glycosyl hydrolase n=1 Tax=Klebsiella sp. TaxID=576 RepID=UPI002584EC67|nr:hypothetical protein [Klebsiella sp.]
MTRIYLWLPLLFSLISFSSFGENKDFYYGVGLLPNRTDLSSGQLFELMQKYKISSFRVDYFWSRVEQKKGVYELTDKRLDNLVKNSAKININPLLILDYGNNNYGGGRPVNTRDVNAYANYSAWVVEHYNKNVHLYEIWNEWWHARHGDNYPALTNSSAIDYFNLVRAASIKIKEKNPQAIILVGSFNPFKKEQLAWAESLVKLGVLNYADGLSIHPYSQDEPSKDFSRLDDFYESMKKLTGKDNIDLYITEMGYSDFSGSKLTDNEIARYIPEYYSLARSRSYIKGMWWYSFINDGYDKSNREHNFGLLDKNLKQKSSMMGFIETIR